MSKKYHIVEIDDLMTHCGYGTSQTGANNGYGCNHPEQEETELYLEEDGYTYRVDQNEMEQLKKDGDRRIKEQGRCFPSTCPLGSHCNEQDLVDYGDGDFDGCDPFDFVLLDDEIYTKLFKEGGE